jgi:hypothetical protein
MLMAQNTLGSPSTLNDVFESSLGRHDWIRTNDLFRVKEAL